MAESRYAAMRGSPTLSPLHPGLYRSLHRSRPQAPGLNLWRSRPGRHQQRQVAQLEREDPPIFIQDGVHPRRAQLHVRCSVSPSFRSTQFPRDVPAGRSFSTTTPYPLITDGRALSRDGCHHKRDVRERPCLLHVLRI